MKIVFRTNGGNNIGLGHLYRCISLAKAIKFLKPDTNIIFFVNHESEKIIKSNGFDVVISNNFDFNDLNRIREQEPDLIIFDSYLSNNAYLKNLSKIAKLSIFDDNNDIYDSNIPDIIINGNLHAPDLLYSNMSIRLLGPKYLVMKEEYWTEINKISYDSKDIMITTGGSDSNRLMIKFIKAVRKLDFKKSIIIGPLYEKKYIKQIESEVNDSFNLIYSPTSLKEYIENSDIVITAAGSTIYEVLTLKRIPIIYTLAKNQELISKKLNDYKIKNLGNYDVIDFEHLDYILLNIIKSKDIYYSNLSQLFDLFDGKGALRVAKILIDYYGGK